MIKLCTEFPQTGETQFLKDKPKLCLWDSIQHWCKEAKLLALAIVNYVRCMCSSQPDSLQTHGMYPPSSSVHGIVQARILEWVAISYSGGSSQPRDGTHASGVSCIDSWILHHWCHLERPSILYTTDEELSQSMSMPFIQSSTQKTLIEHLLGSWGNRTLDSGG